MKSISHLYIKIIKILLMLIYCFRKHHGNYPSTFVYEIWLDRINIAIRFVGQIRRAFENSGPRPVFNIRRFADGQWKIQRLVRIETKSQPKIYYPYPKIEHLLSPEFQRNVESLLANNPVLLSGKSNLKFKTKSKSYVKIPNVEWTVEMYKIRKAEMDAQGAVAITQFDIRSK